MRESVRERLDKGSTRNGLGIPSKVRIPPTPDQLARWHRIHKAHLAYDLDSPKCPICKGRYVRTFY